MLSVDGDTDPDYRPFISTPANAVPVIPSLNVNVTTLHVKLWQQKPPSPFPVITVGVSIDRSASFNSTRPGSLKSWGWPCQGSQTHGH